MNDVVLTFAESARGLLMMLGLTVVSNAWILLPLLVGGGVLLGVTGYLHERRTPGTPPPADAAVHPFPAAAQADREHRTAA